MINESRIDIYDFLYNAFNDGVTNNVYLMDEPQELTKTDVSNGFIVITLGEFLDGSEFRGQAYARIRCYITAYVPTTTRGRLNVSKYKSMETAINSVIDVMMSNDNDAHYSVQDGSFLSMDDFDVTNANNPFHTFIRSFVLTIDG